MLQFYSMSFCPLFLQIYSGEHRANVVFVIRFLILSGDGGDAYVYVCKCIKSTHIDLNTYTYMSGFILCSQPGERVLSTEGGGD
jgi:hypothetical protein